MIGKEKIKDITISEKKGKYNEKKVTKDQWEALIHWNFALVGGFLGAYAILLHMGNFGSAQTGNIMEMAASLVSGEWYDVLLRVLALPLFGGGVVVFLPVDELYEHKYA